MKVIATAALKGGTGKTHTSISLAYVLSQEYEKKVLLIDMDSQSSASIILGVTPNNYDKRTPFSSIPDAIKNVQNDDMSYEIDELDEIESEEDYVEELDINGIHTIFDEMMQGQLLTKALIDDCIHRPYYEVKEPRKEGAKYAKDENGAVIRDTKYYHFGFDFIPSTEYLSDIELLWATPSMKDRKNVGRQLDTVLKFVEQNYNYDYVIIDTAPSLGLLTTNSLYAAKDGIIIPVSQDKQSLFSLSRIKRNIRTIKHARKDHHGILGIVLTIFNEKRLVDKYISLTVGKDMKLKVFDTMISETADAKKALLSGLILPQINTKNYKENVKLAAELIKRIDYLSNRKATNNEPKEMKEE